MSLAPVLWRLQWTLPSLYLRRKSALLRRLSRFSYRQGQAIGDRLADAANRVLVHALAAETELKLETMARLARERPGR